MQPTSDCGHHRLKTRCSQIRLEARFFRSTLSIQETAMQASKSSRTTSKSDDDSLVGVPSHPVAAVVGAVVAGGATGAVVGTAAGPVGTAIGAVVGAVAGGLGGDAIASSVDEAADHAHWRENYQSRPYVAAGSSYDDYGPAYEFGERARHRFADANFNDVEAELAAGWGEARRNSKLEWEQARHAVRDAWDRRISTSRNTDR
jgi:hypothetical protein